MIGLGSDKNVDDTAHFQQLNMEKKSFELICKNFVRRILRKSIFRNINIVELSLNFSDINLKHALHWLLSFMFENECAKSDLGTLM